MNGATTATQLLGEARQALAAMDSPAVTVVDALRTAHRLNPIDGIRRVLGPAEFETGRAPR